MKMQSIVGNRLHPYSRDALQSFVERRPKKLFSFAGNFFMLNMDCNIHNYGKTSILYYLLNP